MNIELTYGALRSFWTLWMMAAFAAIVITALRPGNKQKFQAFADIPLRDED